MHVNPRCTFAGVKYSSSKERSKVVQMRKYTHMEYPAHIIHYVLLYPGGDGKILISLVNNTT